MSISDTKAAQKYASICEVSAAQVTAVLQEALKAPEYTDEAKGYAQEAKDASQQAQDAAGNAATNATSIINEQLQEQKEEFDADQAGRKEEYQETIESLTAVGKPYATLPDAQQALDDGKIPEGAVLYVRSSTGDSLADEYVNTGGVLVATGREMPSQQGINDRWVEFMTLFNSMFATTGVDGFDVIFKNETGQYVGGLDSTGAWNFGKMIAGALLANKANIDELIAGQIALDNGAEISTSLPPGFVFALMNKYKNAAAGLKDDGTWAAGHIEALRASVGEFITDIQFKGGVSTTSKLPPGFNWAWVDDKGQTTFGGKDDGSIAAGTMKVKKLVANEIESASLPSEKHPLQQKLADMIHLVIYGQSLSAGVNAAPLQTVEAVLNAWRFVAGVRAQDGSGTVAEKHASIVGYTETEAVTGDGTGYETPMGGAVTALLDRMAVNVEGYSPGDIQILGSAPGQGSRSISELKQPSGTYMTRVADDMSYGIVRANEKGWTYAPHAVIWMQGETDQSAGTPAATYKNSFSEMVATINSHASTVLGKPVELPWFTYQFNSWINRSPNVTYPTIPLALLDLARTRDDTRLVQPMYMYDYADNAHLLGFDSKICGYRFGLAIEQELITGTKFEPLWSKDTSLQGGVANIWYNPVGKLVLDTSIVTDPGNYGVSAIDPDGNALTLTEVSVHLNRLRIRASGGIPSGSKIRLGFIGGTTGLLPSRTTGPRCCLRDSQGDSIKFDPSGVAYRMDNYAIVEEITL